MKTSKMTSRFKSPLAILFSALSLLTACKKDKDSNETQADPSTYYAVKGTEIGNDDTYKLVSLDPVNLTESVVYDLKDSGMFDVVYSPVTKEILGLDDAGATFIKINPATKQKTTIVLSTELNIFYTHLVFDKDNNLYSIKYEGRIGSSTNTLVKIDVATGKVTTLKPWKSVGYLSYLPSTNDLLGLNIPYRMSKYNLTSQDTSTITLSTNNDIWYYGLFTDNKSGLYAYKMNSAAQTSSIVKLDPTSYAESTVTELSDYRALLDTKIIYAPQRNEILGIWKDESLYRYDLGQKSTSVSVLSTDPNVWYDAIITN